ncbi:MAG TPA: ABC transporter permease [Bacillota bacterium]|nr:ABC transporter permease [Bacillota bacterium]
MLASLKAEFRKLLTIRSTYVIFAIAILLAVFFAFYAEGIKATASALQRPDLLVSESKQAIMATGLLGALVGVLLVAHEYRYNTIMYTLTSSNSRTKTLLAKLVVVSAFAVLFSLTMGVLSPLLTALGIKLGGHTLVHQSFPIWDVMWRVVFVGWGYAIFGFILAVAIRIQVGAISTMFLWPAMLEPLAGLLLRHNASYLPLNDLSNIAMENDPHVISEMNTVAHPVLLFLGYIVLGLIVVWQLFLRRDAN